LNGFGDRDCDPKQTGLTQYDNETPAETTSAGVFVCEPMGRRLPVRIRRLQRSGRESVRQRPFDRGRLSGTAGVPPVAVPADTPHLQSGTDYTEARSDLGDLRGLAAILAALLAFFSGLGLFSAAPGL